MEHVHSEQMIHSVMQYWYRFCVPVYSMACVIFDGKMELFITIKMGKCSSVSRYTTLSLSLPLSRPWREHIIEASKKTPHFDLSNCLSTYYKRYNIIWLTQVNSNSTRPCGGNGDGIGNDGGKQKMMIHPCNIQPDICDNISAFCCCCCRCFGCHEANNTHTFFSLNSFLRVSLLFAFDFPVFSLLFLLANCIEQQE